MSKSLDHDQSAFVDDEANSDSWFEEVCGDAKYSYALNRVLLKVTTQYQDIVLLDTKRFGKTMVIDGKMQNSEADDSIYHEFLIHPPLLSHPNPKTVFIMGGGGGSPVREVLKYKSVDKVVMCDIDKEVVDFCREHWTMNKEVFSNKKLEVVIRDAMTELQERKEKFDVIVGDVSDPIEGGPCYKLFTLSFYQQILKPRLKDNGIFVCQAGPACILTHREVFSCNYNTIKQVFKYVVPYITYIPSYTDEWGFIMASDQPFFLDADKMNKEIEEKINGELIYLDGAFFISSTILNKTVYSTLKNETHIYTENNAKFVHGQGVAFRV